MDIKIDIKSLPMEVGIYKRETRDSSSFKNTKRNGWGVVINPDTGMMTYGIYIPAGAIIHKEKVKSNEEIVDMLEKTQDILVYKKKELPKEIENAFTAI